MCRCVETILLNDGRWGDLSLHDERMNRTRRELFGSTGPLSLERILAETVADGVCPRGTVKGRIEYDRRIRKVEFLPYRRPAIRSLALVRDDAIDYRYKFCDRSLLDALKASEPQADDVLIVRRGLLTDSSFCNIALLREDGRWVTPAEPLLEGTMRRRLLDRGVLHPDTIRADDLRKFRRIALFNALNDWGVIELEMEALPDFRASGFLRP